MHGDDLAEFTNGPLGPPSRIANNQSFGRALGLVSTGGQERC